ncbi:DUF1515 family protein [Rhizobium sp. ARZ01]|uniref:DUF1515 family protein n=1 Tax=Rhizobium sp. ARZ01 TaxID=2769313 RepID=UPI001FF014E3|nr:DUF1515 family protein [Rhizobium sp. ARZ01]
MDELVSRVGHLETGVSELKDDVGEMKPVTEDVKRWKLMGIGALGVKGGKAVNAKEPGVGHAGLGGSWDCRWRKRVPTTRDTPDGACRVSELLQQMELDLAKYNTGCPLSGGQKQRIGIARACTMLKRPLKGCCHINQMSVGRGRVLSLR